MDIILLEDVRNLGRRGEVVKVKPGFARNYLIPRGTALVANKANKAYFDQQRNRIDAQHAKERDAALEIAGVLAGLSLKIAKRVGESETLYGSVTTAEIADLLAEKGVKVDKRKITVDGDTAAIKSLGEHKCTVDLHPEVMAELTVSVVARED